MPRAWRQLAQRADQRAYQPEDVREAVPYALARDFKKEVSGALIVELKKVFMGQDNSLRLQKIALDQLDAVKRLAAGSVFGMNVVGWCVEMVHAGRIDLEALYDAVGFAAKDRAFAGARQVEEHFLRQTSRERTSAVKTRLNNAFSELSERYLGKKLLDPKHSGRSLKKKTDIDDGVPL